MDGDRMRLVFLGSGEFGLPTLRMLHREHEVGLVITQPDRPAGRRRELSPTPVGRFAQEKSVQCIKPENVNDPAVLARLAGLQPEALVVIAYGQKIGQPLLDGRFAINLHSSLLPKYRGAAPINWAIINADRITGVSVITLADRMDAGDILGRRTTSIEPTETAGELHDRLADLGPEVVLEVLRAFRDGSLQPESQDESSATHARKLTKADGTVSFAEPADAVRARVHGLTPWPGCTVQLEGERLKLLRVDLASSRDSLAMPGMIQQDLCVACGEGAIRLLSVQPPGGKAMTFEAYCHGHDVHAGERFMPL